MTSFIDQISSGDAIGAKNTMFDMLSAKAFEALDTRKQELATTLFSSAEQTEKQPEEVTTEEE